MPLQVNKLITEITKIIDKDAIIFEGFPETVEEAADRWSIAFDEYAREVFPISTTSILAKEAMYSILLGMQEPQGIVIFINAFSTYAATLATGMQPLFTSVPPTPASLTAALTPVLAAGFAGADSQTQAINIANSLHTWMKTGTATNNSSGATLNWN